MKLNASVITVEFVATSRSTSKEPIYHEKSTKKMLKKIHQPILLRLQQICKKL